MKNLTLNNNTNSDTEQGIVNIKDSGNIMIENCSFKENKAFSFGGGL